MHCLRALTHTEAAQCITREIQRHEFPGTLRPQLHIESALHDGKLRLIGPRVVALAPRRPANRSLDCRAYLCRGRLGERGTFVEHHRNIGAQILLNLDCSLRCEFQWRTIDMAAKLRTVVGEL